jgi:hypothetical protein
VHGTPSSRLAVLSGTVHGVTAAQLGRRRARLLDGRVAAVRIEHVGDEIGDLFELALLEAARGAAGEPMRMPLVTMGGRGSLGTAFLLTVMCALPSAGIRFLAVDRLVGEVEQEEMVVVPPERSCSCASAACRRSARVRDDLLLVLLELGCSASRNATAFAAMTCMSGPPCVPGNTSELSFFVIASLARARIRPPRGPRSVLCVVVVTTSAYGIGSGYRPAATRPATCAMSTNR